MKNDHLLTGTNPPEFLSLDQLAARARLSQYQPSRLAGDLRLTPRTFERRFRGAFGCAARQWLVQQRMRDALALLGRGLTPKQTAAELHFDYPQSLFRLFRRSFGCTPGEFQRQGGMAAASKELPTPPADLSLPDTLLSLPDTLPRLRLAASF